MTAPDGPLAGHPTPRRLVYTALIGGYEQLWEQPVAAESATTASGVEFVCLTDDPELTSETWDVRLVTPRFPFDAVRSARELKILGHPALGEYDESLWLDARVVLETDPDRILDDWLDGADVAIPRHSFRADVVSEFDIVLATGMDEHARLYEQLSHYAALAPDELSEPVPWTGMLARRTGPEVRAAMDQWFLEVVRYSRRDQLSVVRALRAHGVSPRLVGIDNIASALHTWHEPVGRSDRAAVHRVSASLWPPVAEVGELRHRVEELERRLAAATAEHEQERGADEERFAQDVAILRGQVRSLEEINLRLRKRIRRWRRLLEERAALQGRTPTARLRRWVRRRTG